MYKALTALATAIRLALCLALWLAHGAMLAAAPATGANDLRAQKSAGRFRPALLFRFREVAARCCYRRSTELS